MCHANRGQLGSMGLIGTNRDQIRLIGADRDRLGPMCFAVQKIHDIVHSARLCEWILSIYHQNTFPTCFVAVWFGFIRFFLGLLRSWRSRFDAIWEFYAYPGVWKTLNLKIWTPERVDLSVWIKRIIIQFYIIKIRINKK